MKHMEQLEIKRWRSLANSWRISHGTHDFLTVGPTPHNEKCTPAGSNPAESILECLVYAAQLQRVYGPPPEGVDLVVIESIHDDAGMYHEVGAIYELDEGIYDRYGANPPEEELARTDAALAYVQQLEEGCESWDDTALGELHEAEHSLYTAKVIKMKRA